MRRALLLLLVLGGCDDGGPSVAAPMPDAAQENDVSPPPQTLDGRLPEPMLDATMPAPPLPDTGGSPPTSACIADAALTLSVAEITLRRWGREPIAPAVVETTLTGNACGQVSARSDHPMVSAALGRDGLRVWLTETDLASGRHRVQVRVGVDGAAPLAQLVVNVELLTAGPPGAPRHGLLVGIDGMRSDAFEVAHTPNMDRLARGGDWTVEATTQRQGPTLSGPGWGSILSGVDVDKHGVRDNGNVSLAPAYPSFLQRLRTELALPTAGALQWAPLLTMVGDAALDEGTTGDHAMVTADMLRMLGMHYRALFIHFDDVDHAGHSSGFAIDNPEYIEAIERVDDAIGELMDAILRRPGIAEEDWLLVVTTDHGGRGHDHGPRDEEHWRIPFIVSGPAVTSGTLGGVSHTDSAPTLLAYLGYDLDPSLEFDGQPRGLSGEFNCGDRIDNDGDGDLDCADADCHPRPLCGGGQPESACQDGRDNDHDMLMDCADPDCADNVACDVECVVEDLGQAVGRAVFARNISQERRALASSCGGQAGPEVALRWRAPADDVYLFDTFDSDFDTVLTVRAGECVGPELGCNDQAFGSVRRDTPLPAQSAVRLSLSAGQELTVVFDSVEPAGGNAVLDITPIGSSCPDQDLGSAVGVDVARGNNAGRPTRYLGSCAGTARDAVFVWTAPQAGEYVFDTFGSAFDTVLFVIEGRCGEDIVACNDDARDLQSSVTLRADEGTVYTIVVSGFRGRNGDYRLNISPP